MPREHKFVFFGTPGVAKETLEALLAHGYIPSLVVTQPAAPKGRGLVITPSPVQVFASAQGLSVISPESLDDGGVATAITDARAEYAIVVAYGKMFPESLIGQFRRGVLNIHYSLLPKYRGATPLETALLHGDRETGVTIQKMVLQMDAGDIIAQEKMEIGPEDTARELRPRLIHLGTELLLKILPAYLKDEIVPIAQDHTRATRAYKLKKEHGELDLTASSEANWNKYRAYADTIGTHFFINGKRIKVALASYLNGVFKIERVIPEGKSEMSYADFSSRTEASL